MQSLDIFLSADNTASGELEGLPIFRVNWALKPEKGNMDMTPEAPYNQIINSAPLLKSIMEMCKEG